MKNILLTVACIFLTINLLYSQKPLNETVYFDFDKYELNENAKSILSKCCEKIDIKKLSEISLNGYTDADGSDNYNNILSEKRTREVLKYFVSKGISKNKIKIQFFGEKNPVAQNDNEQGKQKNRRVEITIMQNELLSSDIFSKFKKAPQIFKGSANEDIKITGKEGTVILIPKNSLINKNGEAITGEVTIELSEYYKKSDIIMANLHSMSDKSLLETGGMIYITAKSSGEELSLNSGSRMTIEFAGNKKTDMSVFNGEVKNNIINWKKPVQAKSGIAYKDNGGRALTREQNNELKANDSVNQPKSKQIDNITMTSNQLGWINCDRFYLIKDRTKLTIEIETLHKPVIRIIFKDINSVMAVNYYDIKKIITDDIPIGQKVTLIAFDLVNDIPYYASKEITIGKDMTEKLKLVKTTMSAIQQSFQKLD